MMIYGGIAGAITGVLMVIIMQLSASSDLKKKRITLEDFEKLNRDEYEICYIGHPNFEELLDFENKTVLGQDKINTLKKVKSEEDLPFVKGKKLAVYGQSNLIAHSLHKALSRVGKDYIYLGDVAFLKKQLDK